MLNTNFVHSRMTRSRVCMRVRMRGLMIECPWYRCGRDEWIKALRCDQRMATDPEEKRSWRHHLRRNDRRTLEGQVLLPYMPWRLLSIDVTINF